MKKSILKIIENKIVLKNKKNYCAIIGMNPSNGARSPILWNKVFKKFKVDSYFYPFDIKNKSSLKFLLKELKKDSAFLGGAVTTPYKEHIVQFLDEVTIEAKLIGSVNSIKRSSSGKLVGDNTDGKAAQIEIKKNLKKLKNKSILIIGLGGAGLAVATYIAISGSKLSIWNRSKQKLKKFIVKMKKNNININCIDNIKSIKKFDAIINCTSVGFSQNIKEKDNLPINESLFSDVKKDLFIYDIIYQPLKTPLIKLADKKKIRKKNGLEMNLLQAVIACKSVLTHIDENDIKKTMKNA